MTKFVLVPDSFSGNITFYFDGRGRLIQWHLNSWDIAADLHENILRHLSYCLHDSDFTAWAARYKFAVRREVIDLSFERFMHVYDHARDKFKAAPKWKRMSEKQRFYTLMNVECYNRFCERNVPRGYVKMYPAAYLANHTETNWDKVPDFQ